MSKNYPLFDKLLEDVVGPLQPFETPRASVAYWKKLKIYDEAEDIYRSLGGEQKYMPFPVQEDLWVAQGRLITLDTDLSFNRYRAKTLRHSIYQKLPGFKTDTLRRMCRQHEGDCLKAGIRGGVWRSAESEEHFGEAAAPGDFHSNGAPGWKWRALSEMVTDIMSLYGKMPVLRFSVYDNLMVDGRLIQLRDLLMTGSDERYPDFIKNYISRRLEPVQNN